MTVRKAKHTVICNNVTASKIFWKLMSLKCDWLQSQYKKTVALLPTQNNKWLENKGLNMFIV